MKPKETPVGTAALAQQVALADDARLEHHRCFQEVEKLLYTDGRWKICLDQLCQLLAVTLLSLLHPTRQWIGDRTRTDTSKSKGTCDVCIAYTAWLLSRRRQKLYLVALTNLN